MTPVVARVAVALLLAAHLLTPFGGLGAVTDAPLPMAPVVLRLSPPVWREGRAARVEVLPALSGAAPLAVDIVDVYVVRRDLEDGQAASYVGPDGRWQNVPIALRPAVAVRTLAPIGVEWRERGLPGEVLVEVEIVRPGTDPRHFDSRVAEPVRAAIVVQARGPTATARLVFVGGLTVLTVVMLAWIVTRPAPARA